MQERAVNLEAIGPVHALGEGLFVGGNGELSMVDISRKKIFCGRDRQLSVTCDFVPTAIIGAEGPFLDVVTDRGRVRWDARTMTSSWVNAWRGHIHGGADFRSNDAVMSSCGRLLVGFMSRNDPTHDAGYIYMQERDGELKLLADDIFIPNTFIEIEPNIFLISDSSKSVVHRFEFDSAGKVVSRTVFTEYSSDVAPDGGCMVGNEVFIALWGGSAISVLSLSGTEKARIPVPVTYPTNVKWDQSANVLWCTSASEPGEPFSPSGYDGRLLKLEI